MAQRDPFSTSARREDGAEECGVFASRQAALRTFRALLDAGFSTRDIRMIESEAALAAPTGRPAEADAGLVRSIGRIGAVGGAVAGGVLCEVARTAIDPGHVIGPWAAAASGVVAGAALGGFSAGLLGAVVAQAMARARPVPHPPAPAGGATVALSDAACCDRARDIVRAGGGVFPEA